MTIARIAHGCRTILLVRYYCELALLLQLPQCWRDLTPNKLQLRLVGALVFSDERTYILARVRGLGQAPVSGAFLLRNLPLLLLIFGFSQSPGVTRRFTTVRKSSRPAIILTSAITIREKTTLLSMRYTEKTMFGTRNCNHLEK